MVPPSKLENEQRVAGENPRKPLSIHNPAVEAFVAAIGEELLLAEVLIRRVANGFELRHLKDHEEQRENLREVPMAGLRALAQFTRAGAFRPLKSAPNLQSGWRSLAPDANALAAALQHLYPGAIADWFAAQQPSPPVTNYREFTNRQTGMYRVTQLLTDAQAAEVTRAGCHASFCLKCRLWTVPGLRADRPAEKSLIPCLEPCAVLLEFARKAVRIEQGEKVAVSISDATTALAALESALKNSDPTVREADFGSPQNPRRRQLLLEKLRLLLGGKPPEED